MGRSMLVRMALCRSIRPALLARPCRRFIWERRKEVAMDQFPERLVEGYSDFIKNHGQEKKKIMELAKGQMPKLMVVGCCDSRVPPEIIFDLEPGEMFVVRNVANLVPPYDPNPSASGTCAAIEYAVMALRVQHIVVLGHASCGGVQAFADNEANPFSRPLTSGDFVGKWVKLLQPAYANAVASSSRDEAESVSPAFVERFAKTSIKQSLENLRTFPCIQRLQEKGLLGLHGAFFGIQKGELSYFDAATDSFSHISNITPTAGFEEKRARLSAEPVNKRPDLTPGCDAPFEKSRIYR